MSNLYFSGLAQNYRCFRKVSYFSSKIGSGPAADFEDQLYGDFAFWRFWHELPLLAKSSIFKQ